MQRECVCLIVFALGCLLGALHCRYQTGPKGHVESAAARGESGAERPMPKPPHTEKLLTLPIWASPLASVSFFQPPN
jgi:hypothetical protein